MCTTDTISVRGGLTKVLDTLEMELLTAVNHYVGVGN